MRTRNPAACPPFGSGGSGRFLRKRKARTRGLPARPIARPRTRQSLTPESRLTPTRPSESLERGNRSLIGVVEKAPDRGCCPPSRVFTVIPAKAGMTIKTPSRTSSSCLKNHPPYPPLTGGQEKAKPPPPGGAHRLFIPPCQGGVGGVAFPVEGRPLYLPQETFFNSSSSLAFDPLSNPPLRFTLSSGEAAYRRAKLAEKRLPSFDTPPSAATQDEVDTVAIQDELQTRSLPSPAFSTTPPRSASTPCGPWLALNAAIAPFPAAIDLKTRSKAC